MDLKIKPALPSLESKPKSPNKKAVFFDTMEKLMRQPSLRKDKRMFNMLDKESTRIREDKREESFSEYDSELKYLKEGETKTFIDPKMWKKDEFKNLVQEIIDWMNSTLDSTRIMISDIENDLKDGHVLKELVEKLTGQNISLPAGNFVQSEERKALNVKSIIEEINRILQISEQDIHWSFDAIMEGNVLDILKIIFQIIDKFAKNDIQFDIPANLEVNAIKMTQVIGKMNIEVCTETLRKGVNHKSIERDNKSQKKFQYIQNSMINFANIYLNKINRNVQDLGNDFKDGTNFIFLIGLLEGFFVPFNCFILNPKDSKEELKNMNFCYELLEDLEIHPDDKAFEIVKGNNEAVIRILYQLFIKFKGGNSIKI